MSSRRRVVTHSKRRLREWAKRYPNADGYMNLYKTYRHDTNGILLLDEQGFDRLVLGDPVPDPNVGKRIGPSTGLVFNDEQGNERSGYGQLKVNGHYRGVLGLDSSQGEALTLAAVEDGRVGMMISDRTRRVYVGSAPASDQITGVEEPFYGFLVKGTEGTNTMTSKSK